MHEHWCFSITNFHKHKQGTVVQLPLHYCVVYMSTVIVIELCVIFPNRVDRYITINIYQFTFG